MTIGPALIAARTARGMTNAQLAEAAGVSASRITRYESGERLPSLDVLVRLADALETSADTLLGRVVIPESSGATTRSLVERLGSLTADELQTLNDLVRTWTGRRALHQPPTLVATAETSAPNEWLMQRIERLRNSGEQH